MQDFDKLKQEIESRFNGAYTLVPKENWGVGSGDSENPFAKAVFGQGQHIESVELFFGEHPHSRQDNNIYAKTKEGAVYDFDGHRLAFKIEIEEYNYLKSSGLSGDEIRKGCSVKVFVNGVQILDDFARGYERAYKKASDYIDSLEMMWDWFPFNIEKQIGRLVSYENQLCKISRFIVSQGCMILSTLDGTPFKPFASYEDGDELESEIKVPINSPSVWWHPKTNG